MPFAIDYYARYHLRRAADTVTVGIAAIAVGASIAPESDLPYVAAIALAGAYKILCGIKEQRLDQMLYENTLESRLLDENNRKLYKEEN